MNLGGSTFEELWYVIRFDECADQPWGSDNVTMSDEKLNECREENDDVLLGGGYLGSPPKDFAE